MKAGSNGKEGMSRHRGKANVSPNHFHLGPTKEMNISSSDGKAGKTRCQGKAKGPPIRSVRSSRSRSQFPMSDPDHDPEFVHLVSHNGCRYFQRRRNTRTSHSNNDKKLNTSKFQAHLEDLWNTISKKQRPTFTYVDCLWFHLYKDELQTPKVLGWLKNQNIFSWTYVFVPIVRWSHWSLLILCNSGKSTICMLLLDSLHDTDPMRLEPDIRRFVLDIYRANKRKETEEFISNIPLLIPKVPQQRNGEECGMFVLYFIYLFVQKAPIKFKLDDYPYFLKEDWFTSEGFESFRDGRLNSNFTNKGNDIIDLT